MPSIDGRRSHATMPDQGNITDVAVTDPAADGTMIAVLKGILDQQGNVDVAQMSKGDVVAAHSAITETATSAEIDCRKFSSLILNLEGSLENGQTWIVEILGAAVSGGTFGECYYQDFEQKITITSGDLSTDGVVNFTCPGVQNYVKIRATLSGGTAELTVRATPVNL